MADLSLLFKLKSDASGLKTGITESRQAIASLRSSFGSELNQMQSVSTAALGRVTQSLTQVGGRLPVVGSAVGALNTQFGAMSTTAGTAAGSIGLVAGASVLAISAIGAVATGIFKLAKETAAFGDRLDDLSQRTGITVGTLSTLKIAAENSGSSIESVNKSLGRYLSSVSDANSGNEALRKKFQQVGFTSEDLTKAYKSSDAAISILVKKIGELSNEQDRLNALQKVGVRNGQELNGVINEMQGNLEEFRREAEKLGLVITPEQAKEADKFDKTLHLLELQVKGMSYSIAREYLPQISGAMADVSEALASNKGAWASWGDLIKTEIIGIRVAAAGLGAFIQSGNFAVGILGAVVKSRELHAPEVGVDASVGLGRRGLREAGEGGKAKSQQDQVFKAELEAAKAAAAKELEQQRHLSEQLKNTFDESRATLEEFYRGRQTLIDAHFNTLIDQINREQEALDNARARGRIKAEEANKKDAELSQRTAEATNKLDEETRRNKFERQRALDKAELDLNKQLAEIREAQREGELARIKDALDRHASIEEAAIRDELAADKSLREHAALQVGAIEAEQLRRRQDNLEKQLQLPQTELDLRKKINEELATVSKNLADVERGEIESLLQAATKAALDAEEQIAALRDVDFKKRESSLTTEKLRTTDPAERQKIDEQLKALGDERTEAEKQQAERRKQIAQDEADTRTAILFGNTSEIQRIGAASDAARIRDLQTLAASRVGIEEETARAIAQVHREAEERDAALTSANKLRRRQEELKQTLEGANLELEARKKLGTELSAISKSRAAGERQQIEDLQAAVKTALDVAVQIKALQEEGFRKRGAALSEEQLHTVDPAELKRINEQLKALDAERTEAERQPAARRKQIAQDEANARTAILFGNTVELQRIGAAGDAARIADLQILAAAQIKTAEETASTISQIQRDAAARDAAINQTDKQRQRQAELREALADANLEIEARKRLSIELAAISASLVVGEQRQIEDLQTATRIALDAAVQIAALQEDLFRKRSTALTQEKLRTTDPAELKRINDQLKAIDIARTEAERLQAATRKEIAQNEAATRVAIALGNTNEIQRLTAAGDALRTVSLRALGAARVAIEENTAREIAQIHRDAETRDAAVTKADRLRRRQEELKQTLEGASLELEARKKINTELVAVSKSLIVDESQQIENLKSAAKAALDVEVQIQALQEEGFRKRESSLSQERLRTTDPSELETINEKLKALDAERTEAEKDQAARRKQIAQDEADSRAAIVSRSTSEIQRLGIASDTGRTSSLKILAVERVKVEGDTTRAISEIHRAAEARDSAATKAAELRERQERLKRQIEGSQLDLAARQKLNAELEKLSTERATRERSQIESLLKTATNAALAAEARIKTFQDTDLTKRKVDLTAEKKHADPAEVKRINDQIAALDVQRTENERQQSARREKITHDEADIRAQILLGSYTTIQGIGAATDKARIASQQALADAGIQSAEETAKAISGIKHDAEIRDAEITKTDRLRRREEEIKQILQGANLEVEARKSINAELAQIARDLASVEKRQIEDLIKARTASALKAEKDFKKIEDDALDAREASLKRRLNDPIDVTARQAVIDQLKALGDERVETERQQKLRIDQVHKDEAQTRLEILTASAETIQQSGESSDAQRIASIEAFVALRVKTEEQAEKEILAIKLASADREVEALRIKRTEAGTLADPNAQVKQQAAINNQIKILVDQRTAIEAEGVRKSAKIKDVVGPEEAAIIKRLKLEKEAHADRITLLDIELNQISTSAERKIAIDNEKILSEQNFTNSQVQGERDRKAARQKDLDDERRYADEIITIQQRAVDARRETEQLAINLLVQRRAPQSLIIAAQLKLDLANLKTRHDAIQKSIDKDKAGTDERIATLTKLIAALKVAGKQETDVYQTAVKELSKANEKKAELHREEEEELKRSEAEKQATREKAARDAALAGPGGGFLSGLQTGQLSELKAGIDSFADVATVAFSAVGAAVNGLAKGIGSMVQNWVLMGNQADISMKKLVATVLAGVAAQAATLAVFELALAIAALTPFGAIIYGSAAQHFKAAALFGSIAAVSGIAGRAVAGGSFQQPAAVPAAGAAPGKPTGPPKPVDISRNRFDTTPQRVSAQEQSTAIAAAVRQGLEGLVLRANVTRDPGSVVEMWIDEYNSNGRLRRVVTNDGG